jgi:PST family polysaccharide transporter
VLRIAFWAVLIGLLISITTFLLASFVIQVLSKKELLEAVIFLKILAFVPTLACLNIVNVLLFLVKDQKSLIFRSSWMLCIYMILGSSILTHFFGGVGLAFGLVSGELVVFGICLVLNLIYNKPDMIQMLKIFKKT